jgi:hypothetical protein
MKCMASRGSKYEGAGRLVGRRKYMYEGTDWQRGGSIRRQLVEEVKGHAGGESMKGQTAKEEEV